VISAKCVRVYLCQDAENKSTQLHQQRHLHAPGKSPSSVSQLFIYIANLSAGPSHDFN